MGEIDESISLVNLDDLKEYLQITIDTSDSVLSDLTNAVCQSANNYTGRYLASKSYVEYYDALGMILALRNYPVTSLTSIYDDPNIPPVFGADTLVPATDYQVDKEAGIIRRKTLPFNGGIGNAKVTYVAGYLITAVPYDLSLAIKKWVGLEYMARYKEPSRLGVTQISQGDRNTSYLKDSIPADIADVLDQYKRAGASDWGCIA